MLFHPVEVLFIPAHTVPVLHPKNTVVVVHGLEYEVSPQSYSWWERLYMRSSILYSVRAAQKVIAVSNNTKRDLENLYKVPSEKISVIYEGFVKNSLIEKTQRDTILFIGRIEERKNVGRIIEAFEILKSKYQLPHTLILAGKPGYGYEAIQQKITSSPWNHNIKELGYISLQEKQRLLAEASAFVFPSLYEGFGLPVLEAQAAGIPVITSHTSSLPEVAGEGALFVDPESGEDIVQKLLLTLNLSEVQREEVVRKGYQNLERFSWEKCAKEITDTLIS
jgi:glycosyltransferase involved in cell wall biosynthesis